MSNDDRTPAEKFAIRVNVAMAQALKDGVDPDVIGRVSLNTAREVYEHYGAGDEHDSFATYAVDVAFQAEEIEESLDEREER